MVEAPVKETLPLAAIVSFVPALVMSIDRSPPAIARLLTLSVPTIPSATEEPGWMLAAALLMETAPAFPLPPRAPLPFTVVALREAMDPLTPSEPGLTAVGPV